MKTLKGKPVSQLLDQWTTQQVRILASLQITPKLGIIRVGKHEDDLSYERSVLNKCKKIGLSHEVFEFDELITNEDFLDAVQKINDDIKVQGILMFRPLPEQINYTEVLKRFDPLKDIDGMLPENLGKVLTGESDGFAPCTAEAVFEILKHYEIPIEGSNVAIINSSNVVGKPLAMMLANAGATPTVCHKYTKNLEEVMRASKIVVTAIGRARHFKLDYFSVDQVIIDVGINIDEDGMLCGDVDYENVLAVSAGLTPVPGGVGGVTTSLLLRNVVKACSKIVESDDNKLEVS